MPQNTTHIQAQNPWFGYPFGMTMEKRTVSEGKFGFNGKEKDTDFAEGVYDFGARLYDGRLGRFMGVDKKVNVYAFLSPFCYAANNPIVLIDENGENFSVIVNEDDNTIVIVANIYTINEKTFKQAQNAAIVWNQQRTTYEGYTVSFQINVIPPVNPSVEELQKTFPKTNFYKKNGKINRKILNTMLIGYNKGEAFKKANNDSKGNVYYGNQGPHSDMIYTDELPSENGLVSYVGGRAANGFYISMNTIDGADEGDKNNSVIHEIAHLLGLDDKNGKYFAFNGIMDYGTLKIQDADLKLVLQYAIDNKIASLPSKAKVTIEGCGDMSNSIFKPIIEDRESSKETEIIIPSN